ncbi:ATP-dependent RNA helicase HrpA [Sinimarinibacterium flocculans]|uniref:ATP-dependent RNA helicase HrpA n=1 Tax=Sinimarinibacterium flocculans TaxID=985250 RepID=UPI00248FC29F|nr:ATP-dependent RNA helicase HrpA [Sinimarinibacterium flocculans]
MDLDALRGQLAAAKDTLLQRDAARLAAQLARARAPRFDVARFERDVQQARLKAENRQRLRPSRIDYPAELPVSQAREELAEAIRAHQVVVVCGETGSGKTTQLPKLCMELGRGTRGLIGHTQPRRLAARSVAHRIASELDSPLGGLVGYETRFDRRVSEQSLVKLMTDGILLAELARDHQLNAYDTIIIDEAHERSLNIDFLLGWLKRILPRRPDLKLIVTSATLDPERLSRHFNDAPILQVSGRTWPVEMRYRPADDDADLEGAIAGAAESLWRGSPQGDILVFLPGEREIRDAARVLEGRFPRAEILPLYSRLAATAQDKVFGRSSKPRIVLATNVAETSLTVPGIRYVIDTGMARLNRYAPRTGVQQLQIEPVSQAAANQRAGRCGRLGPGICVRLYAEDDFAARPPFTDPEIKRANLAGVILQMAALGLGRVDEFPWVDPPEGRHVAEAYRVLQTLGAFDDGGRLTALGREIARLPLDPRVARIALAGRDNAAREAIFVLAAAMSVQDPHEVPADAQDAARQKHAQWRHRRSDFLSLLLLWQRWREWSAAHSNRQLRKLCREHYVSFLRMEEWEAVHRQIVDLLRKPGDAPRRAPDDAAGWTAESLEAQYAPIHQALLAGLIDHIGQKLPESGDYQGPKGRRFFVHPGSALAKKTPPWIMSAQLAQTSRLFARTNAAIEPAWLESVGGHLVQRRLLHPTWNVERGEVSATEHLTLLGLPLLTRPRHYGSTHPAEAREIFIREALVGGRMQRKPAFLERNLQLIEEIRDKEARLRRPDLLADDAQLFAFYDAKLPADICTTASLKRLLKDPQRAPLASSLAMAEADALRPGASTDIEDQFPDHLDVHGIRIALSYHHDPGAEHDGVTFHIPLAQVHALQAADFDWLVPGLLAAKLEGLIRTLPNRQRRAFTPAAEFAQAAAARLEPPGGDLLARLCEALTAMTGAAVAPGDFDPERLDAHLRPRFQLEDAQGAVLGTADSLYGLQHRHRDAARTALNRAAETDPVLARWSRREITDWDFDDLPEQVQLASGAHAWPGLAVDGTRIDLRLFESPDAAQLAHRNGVRALLLARMPDRLRDLGKSVRSKLGMLAPAFALDIDAIAQQLAARSAGSVLLRDDAPRSRAAFQAALESRGAFSIDAQRRLDEVQSWLNKARELRARLRGLGERWPASLADLRSQLDSLFAAGFVAAIPDAQWSRVGLYLRAIDVRLERLPNKPARDDDLTRQLAPLAARLPAPFHAARWVLEEWRIALFAQELRAQGGPTASKVDDALRQP